MVEDFPEEAALKLTQMTRAAKQQRVCQAKGPLRYCPWTDYFL